MEIIAELRSRRDTQRKAATALGLHMPSAEEAAPRKPGESDAEYAYRLSEVRKSMASPEFRKALRDVNYQNVQDDEREIRKREREQLAEIRKSVTLDDLDREKIDKEAQRLAKSDLASGKIAASQFGDAILKHAEKLTERRKDEKAHSRMLNAMFRGEIDRNRVKE